MASLSTDAPLKKSKSVSIKEKSKNDNFKFTVCPGNNSRVLLNAFRGRPWLQTASSKSECPGLIWEMYRNPKRYKERNSPRSGSGIQANKCVLNHFEKDSVLVSKHGLYWSLKAYFESKNENIPSWVPETYHIGSDSDSVQHRSQWNEFIKAFKTYENDILQQNIITRQEKDISDEEELRNACEEFNIANYEDKLPCIFSDSKPSSREKTPTTSTSTTKKRRKSKKSKKNYVEMTNVWIAKPASLSNRGIGIRVVTSIEQVSQLIEGIKDRTRSGYIIQKYIERPLLIHGRKFDIRVFLLLQAGPSKSKLQAYLHLDGYIRTSSYTYNLSVKNQTNNQIHLTNDGIQNKGSDSDYGKYEVGNKMNYREFQDYIDVKYPEKHRWVEDVMVPEMEEILRVTVASVVNTINPKRRRNCFELLGCDFMITDDFELKLIEVNSNPCLEFSSPYLEYLIPKVIEDTFQLTVDKYFPPPRTNTENRGGSGGGGGAIITKGTLAAISQINEARANNRFKLLFQEGREPLKQQEVSLCSTRLEGSADGGGG